MSTLIRWMLFAGLLGISWAFAHGGHAHFGMFPAWYSQAQAERGKALALGQCAGCHGAKLEGRYGPPLSGPRFLSKWGGRDAAELRQYIASRMPLGRAGTLSETQTLELVAYILQANGYPAGQQALELKALAQIQFMKP